MRDGLSRCRVWCRTRMNTAFVARHVVPAAFTAHGPGLGIGIVQTSSQSGSGMGPAMATEALW
eukprot:COSAG02_NODE_28811_length_582_cov_0.604555_2_plen_62_part_01